MLPPWAMISGHDGLIMLSDVSFLSQPGEEISVFMSVRRYLKASARLAFKEPWRLEAR